MSWKFPPAGLSGHAVFGLELERWKPRLSQILGIEGSEPNCETLGEAIRVMQSTAFSRAHQEFARRAPRLLGSSL